MLGEYARAMKESSGVSPTEHDNHEQTQPAAMKRDEEHLQQLLSHIEANMTHPFDKDQHADGKLVHIASGVIANDDVQNSLLSVVDSGNAQMNRFIDETLSSDGKKSFYSPITRYKLKTFADMKKRQGCFCREKRNLSALVQK